MSAHEKAEAADELASALPCVERVREIVRDQATVNDLWGGTIRAHLTVIEGAMEQALAALKRAP